MARKTIMVRRKAPVHHADPDAVAIAAEGMTLEHLECRDFRHAWTALDATKKNDTWLRRTRCSRCLCIRTQYLASDFGYIKNPT